MTDASVSSVDAQMNLRFLHFLQEHTGPQYRYAISQGLAEIVNRTVPRTSDAQGDEHPLTSEGVIRMGALLTPTQCSELVSYFEDLPCFNAHVPDMSDGIRRRLGGDAECFHYGSYEPDDVIAAPYLLELSNRPDIIDIAGQHLGCAPTLYSLHAWWSFPGHGTASYSQSFHRDLDDYRFCTLFVFLTDVGPNSGAHTYIRRSHRTQLIERAIRENGPRASQKFGRDVSVIDLYTPPTGYGKDDLYQVIFPGLAETITGPAGTGFFADTSGLHKGEPLTEGRRLMFWARYGLYRNPAVIRPSTRSSALARGRIPSGPQSLYMNRCLLADG
ncbi:MAG TPA: hypothetical protein VGB82_15205 [Alphaproteobacteria bacterium]